MQMNEKQTLLAGAAALALIVFGALFWIAPVWQFGYAPAAYQPPVLPAQAEPAPEPTREEPVSYTHLTLPTTSRV